MSQNVVTYVVEIETDNSDGTLLPYLTANVKFLLAQRNGVLAVPNSAFRFSPDAALVPEKYRDQLASPNRNGSERRIWIQDGNEIRPLMVTAGLNNGSSTEVSSPELREGMKVVTGTEVITAEKQLAAGKSSAQQSPFLPKPPQRPGKKK